MAYTMEEIQKVEPTATGFKESSDSVVISTERGQVLVSKILVESKKPKKYNCMTCGAEITLTKIQNQDVNYSVRFPKKWLKFNLDGTEHKHPRRKRVVE
jgi:hypothetical protein